MLDWRRRPHRRGKTASRNPRVSHRTTVSDLWTGMPLPHHQLESLTVSNKIYIRRLGGNCESWERARNRRSGREVRIRGVGARAYRDGEATEDVEWGEPLTRIGGGTGTGTESGRIRAVGWQAGNDVVVVVEKRRALLFHQVDEGWHFWSLSEPPIQGATNNKPTHWEGLFWSFRICFTFGISPNPKRLFFF